jgi:hypothetical protein
MARKPAAVEQREKDLIAWYKWEFLRRNPEYRKDYANFIQEFGAWFLEHGAWYDRCGDGSMPCFSRLLATVPQATMCPKLDNAP